MSKVATVEVAGAVDARLVAQRLAQLGALTAPALTGDRWEGTAKDQVRVFVEDEESDDGYAVAVDLWAPASDDATEDAAHALYNLLACHTEWGLRRLDFEGSTLATRPAVSRT